MTEAYQALGEGGEVGWSLLQLHPSYTAGPAALELAEGLPSSSSWKTFSLQRDLNQSPAKGIKLCPPREHPAKVIAGRRISAHHMAADSGLGYEG